VKQNGDENNDKWTEPPRSSEKTGEDVNRPTTTQEVVQPKPEKKHIKPKLTLTNESHWKVFYGF
jgi:hypothetical protein